MTIFKKTRWLIAIIIPLWVLANARTPAGDFCGNSQYKTAINNFLTGSIYYNRQDYEKAGEYLQKALAYFPDSDFIKLKLAQTLIHSRKNEEAFEKLMPLSEKNTEYSGEADILLASICLSDKKEMSALSFLNHAVSMEQKNINIYYALSELYEELGMRTEAIDTNLKALRLFPYDSGLQIKLGQLYLIEKKHEKALTFLSQALLNQENNIKLILSIALCHQNLGNFKPAIEYYNKALKIDPLNKSVYGELIQLEVKTGDYSAAFAICEQLITMKDSECVGYFQYAWIALQSGLWDKGITLLESKADLFQENGDYFYWLARLYYAKSDLTDSETNFKKALAFKDPKCEIYYHFALLLHDMKRDEEAIESLRKGILENPQHVLSLNLLGYLLSMKDGPINEAIVFIERALKLEPENPSVLDSMGFALFKKKNFTEALLYQEKAVALSKSPVFVKHLSEMYLSLGEKEKAQNLLKEKSSVQ